MTIANGWRALPGRGTAIASVWPAGTVTACGVPGVEPPALPAPMTVMSACAAVAGAVSTRPTVRPRVAGFPATTPCWVTGAAAAVNEPMPVPGTRTPAMIGTFEDNASPAADAPSELSALALSGEGHHPQLRVHRAGHRDEEPRGAAGHREAGDHQVSRRSGRLWQPGAAATAALPDRGRHLAGSRLHVQPHGRRAAHQR